MTLTVPATEKFNRLEIRGAAYGALDYAADGTGFRTVAKRPKGVVRSVTSLGEAQGGAALHQCDAGAADPGDLGL
jgi:hypothetical protein